MSSEPRTRVLVVDDDEGLATVVRLMLDRAGLDAGVAYSGQEALDWIETHGADIVLLDMMMPDMNGFAFLRLLRENAATRDLPVIVLTALADEHSRRECAAAGANDYLTKPVSRSVLIEHVRALVGPARSAPV